jgi:protoheme ferro-lyase
MKVDGVQDALAFFTSAFSCYSGCRQYRENIFEAPQIVGPGAPQVHKLRMPFNDLLFIEAAAAQLRNAIDQFCNYLSEMMAQGIVNVAIMPIGFPADHMEVMFDLAVDAREKCVDDV